VVYVDEVATGFENNCSTYDTWEFARMDDADDEYIGKETNVQLLAYISRPTAPRSHYFIGLIPLFHHISGPNSIPAESIEPERMAPMQEQLRCLID
jgi:hypothetical protein